MIPGSDCPTGKVQYTAAGARDARGGHRARGDRAIKCYRCPICGCFHLGHTNRRRERLRDRVSR